MNSIRQRTSLMMMLAGALLALLPVLAVLQYRWLTEVSKAEHRRMKDNLQVSATQFCQEFDRELTQAYLNFQHFSQTAGSGFGRESDIDPGASYRYWRENAAHPRIVGAIYEIRRGLPGSFAEGEERDILYRFNPGMNRFEACEWPEEFGRLRSDLSRQRAERTTAQGMLREVFKIHGRLSGEAPKSKGPIVITRHMTPAVIDLSTGAVDENIPGLVIPIFGNGGIQEDLSLPLSLPRPAFYRVIALDSDYLAREFIPELVKRHFLNGTESRDFNIAILRRAEGEAPVYRSSETMALGSGDVTESLFRVRMNPGDRMIFSRMSRPPGGARSNGGGGSAKSEEKQSVASIFIQSDVNVRRGGNADSSESPRNAAMMSAGDEGRWRVIVRHRAGSLDAAVTATLRRNLAISFGVLLLMGISVGLIVISSRRAQTLAERQMEFVAGVSHELRTPLAVICSAGENLADGVIANREQIQRYGGLIRDEGRRLTGMVEQVLEFAGAQSGRKSYEIQPVGVGQVLDDALSACRMQRDEGGFEIAVRIPEALPTLRADAAALSRALQNLLGNAMKYSGESRWIGLEVEVVRSERAEEVRIHVSDRGLGIAPQELPHIFESFYRGAEVAAAQIHGNGLGLSLVKHIIDAHGGRVTVESRPNEGSRFTIHLPVAPPASEAVSSASQVPV
ncbi:MAG: sensor histidine kinase [Blastocatellia bacterium]